MPQRKRCDGVLQGEKRPACIAPALAVEGGVRLCAAVLSPSAHDCPATADEVSPSWVASAERRARRQGIRHQGGVSWTSRWRPRGGSPGFCATNGSSAQTVWSSMSTSGMRTRRPRWRTYARSGGSSVTDSWAWSTAPGSPSTGPRVRSYGGSWTALARRTWPRLAVSHARTLNVSAFVVGRRWHICARVGLKKAPYFYELGA